MAKSKKKSIYEDGVRFEVTPYGLVCCLNENKDKKHQCLDCKFCQWCSDSRCSLCLRQGEHGKDNTGSI
jgi:hypothetical protein